MKGGVWSKSRLCWWEPISTCRALPAREAGVARKSRPLPAKPGAARPPAKRGVSPTTHWGVPAIPETCPSGEDPGGKPKQGKPDPSRLCRKPWGVMGAARISRGSEVSAFSLVSGCQLRCLVLRLVLRGEARSENGAIGAARVTPGPTALRFLCGRLGEVVHRGQDTISACGSGCLAGLRWSPTVRLLW